MDFDFVPSEALVRALARHRPRTSRFRLDLTSKHMPGWPLEPISLPHVKEAVQERMGRLLASIGRRARTRDMNKVPLIDKGAWVDGMRKAVRKDLHLKIDQSGERLLAELAREFTAWVRGQPANQFLRQRGTYHALVFSDNHVVMFVTNSTCS